MHIVFGQIDEDKSSADINRLLRLVKSSGCGTYFLECVPSIVDVSPMSWSVKIELPEHFLGEWAVGENGPIQVLNLIREMAMIMGVGKYHFRGRMTDESSSFWDTNPDGVVQELCIFGGIPLSISVTAASCTIDIPMGWTTKFVAQNYPNQFDPLAGSTVFFDTLRGMYLSVCQILSLEGKWRFLLST